jgi:SPP1 family phage portal protein
MQLSKLQELLSAPDDLISKIQSLRPVDTDDFESIHPETHEVMDPANRKKREVHYDTEKTDENDDPIFKTVWEEVTRLPSTIEKQVINWAVTMAAGKPVQTISAPKNTQEQLLSDMVNHELKSNKVDFKDKEVVRLLCTYKRVAEVWFSEECPPEYWGDLGKFTGRMRLMLLSYETGDKLFPLFDNKGDFIALTREYSVFSDEDKKIDMFDVYMSDNRYTYAADQGSWALAEQVKNLYGKINVIYYQQDRTEYADIVQQRRRLETLNSDLSEQNIATGFPLLAGKGIKGLGPRGEVGKVFDLEDGGDIKFVEATGAPESVRMERENLLKDIWAETSTPDMAIFEAQGMGANVPGITIKLRFLPATLKALSRQTGEWGMGYQRRLNFLKAACAVINPKVKAATGVDITPKFGVYLPSNDTENFDNIVKLVGAGLMSKETAVKSLDFTEDPEAEYARILAEQQAFMIQQSELSKLKAPTPTPAA